MTYTLYDQSANMGQPFELFKFESATDVYRYTNKATAESFEGEDYTPLNIARGVTEQSAATDSAMTIDFSLPVTAQLFEDYGRGLSPPDMTVTVYRKHRGATGFKRMIVGTVSAHSTKDEIYTLRTKSTIQTELNRKVASVYYQTSCNHVLFDNRCKISRAAWETPASVVTVSDYAITVDDDAHANGALLYGEIKIGAETRVIVGNIDNVIGIAYPFIKAQPGDGAVISRGCDLLRSTCVGVFGNIANFGGFPTIPTENPALPDFDLVNTTTENRRRVKSNANFWGVSISSGG